MSSKHVHLSLAVKSVTAVFRSSRRMPPRCLPQVIQPGAVHSHASAARAAVPPRGDGEGRSWCEPAGTPGPSAGCEARMSWKCTSGSEEVSLADAGITPRITPPRPITTRKNWGVGVSAPAVEGAAAGTSETGTGPRRSVNAVGVPPSHSMTVARMMAIWIVLRYMARSLPVTD